MKLFRKSGAFRFFFKIRMSAIVQSYSRFSLSVDNEKAGAGRDSRTCLAKPNSQARTGTGKKNCSADHEQQQDWQPYPGDPYSAVV